MWVTAEDLQEDNRTVSDTHRDEWWRTEPILYTITPLLAPAPDVTKALFNQGVDFLQIMDWDGEDIKKYI
jgi:hypothetical protein